jgi:endoglucanase
MGFGSCRQLAAMLGATFLILGGTLAVDATGSVPARGRTTAAKTSKHGPRKARTRHKHAKRHHQRHRLHRQRIGPRTAAARESASGLDAPAGAGPASGSPAPAPSPSPAGPSSPAGDPFAGQSFYVEPNSSAVQTEHEWASQGRSADAAAMAKIASQPDAQWFGDWSDGHGGTQGDVNWSVSQAVAAGSMAVLVAYDIPWRDCGQYSSGGATSPAAYREFINGMAAGIGNRRAAVILEPDALSELSCLSGEQQSTYYSLLTYAVQTLSAQGVAVYLDAGHSGWQSAETMAARLKQADLAGARGFALNVSNFDATSSEVTYGEAIAHAAGGSPHFIVDTSRNGRGGVGGEWCNPPGRGLGVDPTASTGNAMVDAFFWIKTPGQSDGACNGGPSAGQWWSSYALELARNAAQ